MRIVRLVATRILPALVLLLLLLLAVLQLTPVKKAALSYGAKSLEKSTGMKLEEGQMDFSFFLSEATLKDIQVDFPDQPGFLKVETLTIRSGFLGLIGGLDSIDEIYIKSPRIHFIQDDQESDNVTASDVNGPATPILRRIPQIKIENIRVLYEDEEAGFRANFPSFHIQTGNRPEDSAVSFTSKINEPASIEYGEIGIPIESFSVEGQLSPQELLLERLQLGSSDSFIQASGNVFFHPEISLDLEIQSHIESSLLEANLPDFPLSGALEGKSHLQGVPGKLKAKTALTIPDLHVRNLDPIRVTAEASLDQENRVVTIDPIHVESESGRMKASSDIHWDSNSTSRLESSVSALDVGRLMEHFGMQKYIAARAEGSVTAYWPGLQWEKIQGTSDWELEPATSSDPSLPVTGKLRIAAEKNSLILTLPQLQVAETNLSGEASLNRVRHELTGEINGAGSDLGATMVRLDHLFKWDVIRTEGLNGPWNWSANLSGSLDSPGISWVIECSPMSIGKITGGSLKVVAHYDSDNLNVSKFEFLADHQRFYAEGSLAPVHAQGKIAARGTIENLRMETITSLFASAPSLEGVLSADWKGSGSPEAPEIQMTVKANESILYGNQFGTLEAEASYKDGWIQLERLQLNQPGGGTLEATGRSRLSGDYELQASATNLILENPGTDEKLPISAVVDLNLKGSGTFDDPHLIGQVNLSNAKVAGVHLDSVQAEINISNGESRWNAVLPSQGVQLQARIATHPPYTGEITLETKNTDLSEFAIEIRPGVPLQGKLEAMIQADGDWKSPESSTVQATITALRLEASDSYLQNSGPVQLEFKDQVLHVHPSRLVGRASNIRVEGSLPLRNNKNSGELRIDAEVDLSVFSHIWLDKIPSVGEGSAHIVGTVLGSLEEPVPNLTLSARATNIQTTLIPDLIDELEITVQAKDDQIQLQKIHSRVGDGQITVEGIIPIDLDSNGSILHSTDETHLTVDANHMSPAILPGLEECEGTISFHADVRIPGNEISQLQGVLDIQEAIVSREKVSLQIQTPTTLKFDRGAVQVEKLIVKGPDSEFIIRGFAGLESESQIDLHLSGEADPAISKIVTDIVSEGRIEADLHLTGNWSQPKWKGYLQVVDGQYSMRRPDFHLAGLNTRWEAEGNQIRLIHMSGNLNGGDLTGEGFVRLVSWKAPEVNLRFKAEPVYLKYPLDLRTASKIELAVTSTGDGVILIGGNIQITEGGYVNRIDLSQLSDLTAQELVETSEPPELDRIHFDINIRTKRPLIMKNNLGQLAAQIDLKLVGTVNDPGMLGTIEIERDTELYVMDRTFVVKRGIIQFSEKTRIEPITDFQANTTIDSYNITVRITGTPDNLETRFQSDPPLPEDDVYWVLLTGSAQDVSTTFGGRTANRDPSALLTAGLTVGVSQRLQKVTGTQVRIEYDKFTSRGNPGQWLTLTQPLTGDFKFSYSTNLKNSDQIWDVDYRFTKHFQSSLIWESDSTQTTTALGIAYFGGRAHSAVARVIRPKITSITLSGELLFPEAEIRNRLKIKTGDGFEYLKVLENEDRIRKYYYQLGYPEIHVRSTSTETTDGIQLEFDISPGRRVEFTITGFEFSKGVRQQLQKIWFGGIFDRQREDDSTDFLKRELIRRGYVSARVSCETSTNSQNHKIVDFRIDPGIQYKNREIRMEGVSESIQKELQAVLDHVHAGQEIYMDPDLVTEPLLIHLQSSGYLESMVLSPNFAFEDSTAVAIIPIVPGALYHLGSISFQGNRTLAEQELLENVSVKSGTRFLASTKGEFTRAVLKKYADIGYRDTEAETTAILHPDDHTVELSVEIQENARSIVEEIEIEGNERISEKHARNLLKISEGEPEAAFKINDSRTLLYDSGGFSAVDIESEPLANGNDAQFGQPVRLTFRLSEPERFHLIYGGYYNTDRGPGGLASIQQRNFLGGARSIGFQLLLDRYRNEQRILLTQPVLAQKRLETNLVLYRQRDQISAFDTTTYGVQAFQNLEIRRRFIWTYGYRYEDVTVEDIPLDFTAKSNDGTQQNVCATTGAEVNLELGTCKLNLSTAPLVSSITLDTRDNLFDATRGAFHSHSLEYSPGILGGNLEYIRYYGQLFKYFPLSSPSEVPFSDVKRSRFIYAAGVRLGLSTVLGDSMFLFPTEQFFAGGASTVRGFPQNGLGPQLEGEPIGGNAMFILNNELRFPVAWWFDGAAFLDIGQVFSNVSDFRISELRETAGIGLRLRNPFILLRFDYGWKLDRREGESPGHFHFSIAQAF